MPRLPLTLHRNRLAVGTMRLLAWLASFTAVLCVIAIVMPSLNTPHRLFPLDLALLAAGGGLLAAGLFRLARGLIEGRPVARYVSMVFAALVLVAFPLGTLAGAIVLWRLALRWEGLDQVEAV